MVKYASKANEVRKNLPHICTTSYNSSSEPHKDIFTIKIATPQSRSVPTSGAPLRLCVTYGDISSLLASTRNAMDLIDSRGHKAAIAWVPVMIMVSVN